jgi:hypothetical protein
MTEVNRLAPCLRQLKFVIIASAFVAVLVPRAQAHDIYTGLRQPHTGASCCSNDDCAPAKEDVILQPNGSDTLPARGVTVQQSKVLPSPDGRYHICAPPIFPWHVICLLVPFTS